MHFGTKDIQELQERKRANLINCISGYKSANLIATCSNDGFENVAVFNSVVHFGSNPPILGFILRPTTVARNTYDNIKENGFYTINHIHQGIFEEAHHTSAKYPKQISEFTKTNLKPEYKCDFFAPFVEGCKVQMALEFLEEYHIKANGTIMILGEIKHLFVEDTMIFDDGFVDLSKGKTACINGLEAYAFPNSIVRLGYQRPKE